MHKSDNELREIYQGLRRNDKRTLVSLERFINAYKQTYRLAYDGSCVIECGTWKCGVLGAMALAVNDKNVDCVVYGLDTFAGIPDPTPEDGPKAQHRGVSNRKNDLLAPIEVARDTLFNRFALPDNERIVLLKGLFADTLPGMLDDLRPIAVLRLDCDWYEPTMFCLDQLYDRVIPGGAIIIDDYGHWPGCKKAVDEFRATNNIEQPLVKTDYTEFWWSTKS